MYFRLHVLRLVYSLVVICLIVFGFLRLGKTVETAVSSEPAAAFSNFDIRTDSNSRSRLTEILRSSNFQNDGNVDLKKSVTRAVDQLSNKMPSAKLDFGQFETPEIISTHAGLNPEFLTLPDSEARANILRNFLLVNSDLFGLSKNRISELELSSDYSNPDGGMSFVHFLQKIDGIPVFQGELKAAFSKRGEIIRLVNNLAPNPVPENTEFGDPQAAVVNAAEFVGEKLSAGDLKLQNSKNIAFTFETAHFDAPVTVEKVYFPLAFGVVRPSWKILIWTKTDAFYVIVDAAEGELFWRKNITENQTQSSTFDVYGTGASFLKTHDSPAPFTPGCATPAVCPEPSAVSRQSFTLVGNEPPYTFNDLGWVPDGENRTIGNAVEAGIDRIAPNGIDDNGWAFGSPNRNFVYTYNPAPGIPAPGEMPIPATQTYPPSMFQQGSVTHAFYAINRWHDEMYLLGFNEAALNFQTDNFGRGGMGNDSISVEVQDGSGSNSANFSTPADGGRPRLQLFVWSGSTPNRDGALDSQVAIHEVTHGLSGRLHGNAGGLTSNMARGMGEGWSDFYSLALLSEPTDDISGIYSIGCYSISGLSNCYYGIRRFPTARISVLGTNGLPHNPLTFRDLNADCSTHIGTTTTNPNSAFPRGPIGSAVCDQIHNIGEVWSAALWEVRGFLIDAHGAAEGNRRALKYITDGMKLAPINPTILQERDAIIFAAQVGDPADVIRVWRGFAARGMGFSASIINPGNGSNNTVVSEAFDTPNAVIGQGFSVSDVNGNNNGFPEPGEPLVITVPISNNTGTTLTGITVQVSGGSSAVYGDIANGQTVSRDLNFTVPSNAPCPGEFTLSFEINSGAGQRTETRSIFLGVPVGGPPVSFENAAQIDIPAGQPTTTIGVAAPYPSQIVVSGLTGNKKVKLEISGISHSFPGDIDFLLVGPGGQKYIFLSDSGGSNAVSNLTFALSDSAGSQPSVSQWTSGTFRPYNSGANDSFAVPAPSIPYLNAEPAGGDTFESAFGLNSAGLNGTWALYAVDDTSSDSGFINGGWKLTFESNDYTCVVCRACPGQSTRADFDGDGKSDVSVFRPSGGIWYVNGSASGFSALNWGISSDELAPGDFDGDSKTDFAVFRPNADSSQPDFYILNSSDFTFSGYSWGLPGDVPVIEDYDGDGRDDVAIHRPSTRISYVLRSSNGSVLTSRPQVSGASVTGDFDGDGKGDFAVFSNGQWFISRSSDNHQSGTVENWGLETDKLVPADYDGDGIDDLAVYRPSEQVWYIRKSSGGNTIVQFGLTDDIPVPGDYDGDGKADIGVYRDGVWYIERSASGIFITQFGLSGDVPVASQY